MPSVLVVATCCSGHDLREEDVRRPVLRLRSPEREDGGEPTSEPSEPLILADPVVGDRSGSDIGGAGDVSLPPRGAAIVGMGEPDISCQAGVARDVVAEVVPDDAHGAVLVDCDGRLERKGLNAWQRDAAPCATTVERPDHSDGA